MKQKCTCGCGKTVDLDKSAKPIPFKIVSYTNGQDPKPLEVERLSDNMTFRIGDTVKRSTRNGKKFRRFILYKIVVTNQGSLLLWGYTVDKLGMVRIDNDRVFVMSNQNPNLFETIYK